MPFTGGNYGFGGVNPYGGFGGGFGYYNAGPTRGQFLGLSLGSIGIGLLGALASGADKEQSASVGISAGLGVLGQSAGGITGAILGGVFGTLFNPAAIHNVFKNGLGQGLKNIFTFGYARKPKATEKKTEPAPDTTKTTEPKPTEAKPEPKPTDKSTATEGLSLRASDPPAGIPVGVPVCQVADWFQK